MNDPRASRKRPLLAAGLALALGACATAPSNREPPAATASPEPSPATASEPTRDTHPTAVDGAAAQDSATVTPVRPDAPPRHTVVPRSYPEPATPAGLPMASADPSTMVAHFINVGQGDAILLEFSCGAVLIDTGGERTTRARGSDLLRSYLEEFFGRRHDLSRTLDLVVLSHPHSDHTDGASALVEADPAFDVLNLLDDGEPGSHDSGRKGQLALQRYVAENEGGYVGLSESDVKNVSGVSNAVIDPVDCRRAGGIDPKIVALWGRVDLDVGWANDRNNDSVVVRVDFGKASFLFVGDMEHQGLSAMLESYEADPRIFDVDVLKVGHHGSMNATTPDFVRATSPKIAVIQAGDTAFINEPHNAYVYGHPNRAAIRMLLADDGGVSTAREPTQVRVGIKGKGLGADAPPPQFTRMRLDKAIYSNSWDGNIAVVAQADGTLEVETEY